MAAVATAPPPERQLAVLKLEGLKRQLRSLVKSKKKATMVDVFRRLERSEGSGKEYWRLWNAHKKDFLASDAVGPQMRLWGRTVWWSDPVEVLRTWREYGQALGKERPISQHGRTVPNSDRREGATPRDFCPSCSSTDC